MEPRILLEACVESAPGALVAGAAGADRVELCSDLAQGGVTPGPGTIEVARRGLSVPLVVLVRPRPGDFVYSEEEHAVSLRDVAFARAAGAHGVALGALTRRGRIDRDRTRGLVEAARPMAVTFHRAFDELRDLDEGLDTLLSLGVERVLTAGGARRAENGLSVLADLVRRAGTDLAVIVAGSVRPGNASAIAAATGARELHFRAEGGAGPGDVGGADRVRAVREALRG